MSARFAIAACLLAAACQGGATGQAPVSTDVRDAASGKLAPCALEPGRSWRFETFEFLGGAHTTDYGDGAPRNAMQVLAQSAVSMDIERQIASGIVSFGLHIAGFDPSALGGLSKTAVQSMTLPHEGHPDGSAAVTYCADPEQFDVECKSWSHSDELELSGAAIVARAGLWPVVARNFGVGTIDFRRARITIENGVRDQGAGASPWDELDVKLEAIWPACSLANTIAFGGTFLLEFLLEQDNPDGTYSVAPDYDLAAQRGLEGGPPVIRRVAKVTSCRIGEEVVTGRLCACDPRIDVGYSVVVHLRATRAEVRGLCDEP